AALASATFPTICVQRCSVAYVSFHASYGRAGQATASIASMIRSLNGGHLRAHRSNRRRQAAQAPRLRGMRQDRGDVDAPADVPDLRRHAVLRLVTQPPRKPPRTCRPPSGRGVRRAGRALALLLSRRHDGGILSGAVGEFTNW